MIATEIEITGYKKEYDDDIERLCHLFVDESLAEYGLNVTRTRLDQMIELCKQVSWFLVDEGKPVGLIAGLLVSNLTNGKPALQEVIWYVDKPYRSKGHLLMQAFERQAREMGLSAVVMALMCNSMSERLDRVYKRLGFVPFEVQYIKELK